MEKARYRHEFKYLINNHDICILESRLKHIMKSDENSCGDGSYNVRSLYFDDANSSGLFEKNSGTAVRGKYRIRVYNGSDKTIKLERKSRNNHLTRKDSKLLSLEEYYRLLGGEYQIFRNNKDYLSKDFFLRSKNYLLQPKVIVDYKRKAFIHTAGNVRVTFDSLLRFCINSKDIFRKGLVLVPVCEQGISILEVKFDSYFPDFIRAALQTGSRTQISFSKFTVCCKYFKQNDWEDS